MTTYVIIYGLRSRILLVVVPKVPGLTISSAFDGVVLCKETDEQRRAGGAFGRLWQGSVPFLGSVLSSFATGFLLDIFFDVHNISV